MTAQKNLGPWRLAAFALPGAPLTALSVPPIVFLPTYYAGHLGVAEAVVGGLFVAARLLDMIINPTIGALQDRTRTALGRRRAWMIAATPAMMAVIWLAFIALPPGVGALAVGLTVMAFYSTFAAMMIAHLGWAGQLKPDYHGRTQVLGAVQLAGAVGQLLILALPAVVEGMGGTFADGVHAMGWALIVAVPLTVAVAAWGTPEPLGGPQPAAGFAESFAALRQNATLRRLLLPDFLIGVVQGVTGALFFFYFQYGLGFQDQAAGLLFVYFICGLLGVPIWVVLGKRLGKHRAMQLGALWWAAALAALPFVPQGNFAIAVAGLAFAGLAQGAGTLLMRSMMADLVDEDALASGAPRPGLFFGLLLSTTKLGLAFGPLTFVILSLFGFDDALGAANSPQAMLALTVLFGGAPFALNLVVAWSLRGYPLDAARQVALRAALEARGAG